MEGAADSSHCLSIWETEGSYQVCVVAPGLDVQHVDVSFHDDTLAIEGTLASQASEGAKMGWQEFNPGPTPVPALLASGSIRRHIVG